MAETLATYQVPEHHVTMFTANVRMALARTGGIFRSHVTNGSYVGEKVQVVNFIGTVEFIKRDTPYQDTVITEPEHTQRWIAGDEYDAAILVDRLDTLKMIYDPSNPYVEALRAAAGRKEDDIIIDAFFADAKAGKNATVTIPFPSQDTILHAGTGLSVAKLRTLRKLYKKRHVDLRLENPRLAFTSEQADNLLGETVVGSNDYNSVKPLVDGEVSRFMGFDFIPAEDALPSRIDTAEVVRQCPSWVPSGMHYGSWQDLVVTINNRPDKNNIKQIHATFTGGATRLEEGKVFMVECNETTP